LPRVSQQQIEKAKEVGILEYLLSHEPDNIKKIGNAHYLKDHDSLEISNGLWNWHSQGVGGKNVIDYLVKVRGYNFVDAVIHLAGEDYSFSKPVTPKARLPNTSAPKQRDSFRPPLRNSDNKRVIEYLQNRGIQKNLILDCIKRGSIYESANWHNCVFVGRDDKGKARFAALRGTASEIKRDADGSDKRFGFVLPSTNVKSDTVAVFESPIDALSHQALYPNFDGWRLSLGCTALSALNNFLERHNGVKNCVVCTDNDDAGNNAAQKIAEIQGIKVSRFPPPVGKDWNEFLQIKRNEVIEMEDVRKPIVFRDSHYNESFRIKDGDSIKITVAYDGEELIRKCRWIDEAHTKIGSEYYHNDEFASKMAKNGNKYEPIPKQKPQLDILAAKYGENLQDVSIPMTEAALRKLVGGKYDVAPLRYQNGQVFGAVLSGKIGIAVCGMTDDKITSLHPYDAQTQKRELANSILARR